MRTLIIIGSFITFLLLPLFALAQASQPASQPAFWTAAKAWLLANWVYILMVVAIPSIINGLKKKSWRKGSIGGLEALLDRFSLATNKNTVGTFKAPGTRSGPPVDPPKG